MLFRLIVKGDEAAAAKEATRREVTFVFTHMREGLAYGVTDAEHAALRMWWLARREPSVPGIGYPPGSLLAFFALTDE